MSIMTNRGCVCPVNADHKEFLTGATIFQEWKVDRFGEFIAVTDDFTGVMSYPDPGNGWTCAECDALGVYTECGFPDDE
jgi:hypothetical protein